MDLGTGIRKALARITGAAMIDEQAVKELVKELQRALLQSDVNVKLVFELTKKIEARALKQEREKLLSLREHVVKVVYEELAGLLGERFEPRVGKQKIMVVGLFGSGKCVHPDTLIPIADGRIARAKDLWELRGKEEEVPGEGSVKELETPLEITSFDLRSLKAKRGRATHVWKLKKTAPLIRVGIRNGNAHQVTTTPEHPFFALEKGQLKQVRADELRLGQYLAVPRKLVFDESNELRGKLLNNLPKNWQIRDKELAVKVREKLCEIGEGTLQAGNAKLETPVNYCMLSSELKAGIVRSSVLKELAAHGWAWKPRGDFIIAKSVEAQRWIRAPLSLTEEFAEFLGYLYADGNIDRHGVKITNESPEINERLPLLGKSIFEINPTTLLEKRSKVGLMITSFSSKTLLEYLYAVFDLKPGRKSNSIRVPLQIFLAPESMARAFLRAYFDCDGFANAEKRSIEFCSASKQFAYELRLLLLKFEIHSTISKKTVNETPYYRLFLKSSEAEKFAKIVSSITAFKLKRLESFSRIGETQGKGIHENIPVGSVMKEVRERWGATIGEIQQHVSSYGTYESEGAISRISLEKFTSCLHKLKHDNRKLLEVAQNGIGAKDLPNALGYQHGVASAMAYRLCQTGVLKREGKNFSTTLAGQAALQVEPKEYELRWLEMLASSNVLWLPVTKLETIEGTEWVYDLTVEKYHNFVADGFIVHNTTSIGKLAKYYQAKGLKIGVIAADVHRPAAIEQLRQISQQVKCEFYGKEGQTAEENARNGLRELEKLKCDVIILDTAGRSAFDQQLSQELKELNSAFQPDEKYLVVSADIGQVAGKQAAEFEKTVNLTGVIVSKMDGSGKGGGALSAVHASNSKVAFIGTGEKPEDLQQFDAKKFVARLCGFPDLQELMSKARELSQEEHLQKAMEEGKLDYNSFLAQMKSMKKMGPLKGVFQMLGVYDLPEEMMGKGEEKLNKFEAVVKSMTPKERREPELMKNSKRQERVARGSGADLREVRELVGNFEKINKMMKGMRGDRSFMKKLGNMMRGMGGTR